MWLIEYRKEQFVNADLISELYKANGMIYFCLSSVKKEFEVCPEYQDGFLNHLQALNKNISNVERLCKRTSTSTIRSQARRI